MAKLILKDKDKDEVREFPLKPAVTTIGRVVGQDIFLPHDSVSRHHAEVRCIDDEYYVVDLESLNGVFVNDNRVSKSALREGDIIRFGKVFMKFSLAPCERELERRSVIGRFLGGLQESASSFELQFGSLFNFISTGTEKVEELESSVFDTLRKRTNKFEQAYRQLTILYRVSQIINTDIEVGKVLGNCVDLAVTTLKAERGVVLLYNAAADDLEIILAKSRVPSETKLIRAGWLKGIARRVFETREPMILSPGYATENLAALTHAPNQASFICSPIFGCEEDIKGVLYFDSRQKDRSFYESDIDFLATFGAQIAMGLDRDSLINQVVVKKEMEKEMGIAHEIQQRLLPKRVPVSNHYRVAGRSLPSKMVGGDYYDFFNRREGGDQDELSVIVADVSGKGIPAALVLSQTRSILKIYAQDRVSPALALERLNEYLLQDFDGSMYVTLVYCIFDFANSVMRYANAGHEWPILVSADAPSVTYLDKSSKPCGLFEGEKFEVVEVSIKAGDRFIFPTDGVIDAESRSGEKFGVERLQQAVVETRDLDCDHCLDFIFDKVSRFSSGGGPQFDDMTLVIVDIGPQSRDTIRVIPRSG